MKNNQLSVFLKDHLVVAHVGDKPKKMTVHVVTSQGRVILGVFGEALLSRAQECARRVSRETGFPTFVNQVQHVDNTDRPRVGEVLP